ncbi:hypothetical protein BDN71DRAFT_1306337 [Pleurotus eryngii]|uniref:Uncharacterized protein n=1 Tax=Pleurotus eryngii TaxID=5323 RepID=A0A9P5ZRV6_PLEER|nr:hypothetical protein BDN71DRAFT_1306337 [Pleurotus eryngii]
MATPSVQHHEYKGSRLFEISDKELNLDLNGVSDISPPFAGMQAGVFEAPPKAEDETWETGIDLPWGTLAMVATAQLPSAWGPYSLPNLGRHTRSEARENRKASGGTRRANFSPRTVYETERTHHLRTFRAPSKRLCCTSECGLAETGQGLCHAGNH